VNGVGLQKSFPAGEAEVEVHLECVCLNSHESAASNIPSLRGPHQLQHEIWMEILLLIKFLDIIYHSEQIASRRCNRLTPDMTSVLAMQIQSNPPPARISQILPV
jgi:hypothetical protein